MTDEEYESNKIGRLFNLELNQPFLYRPLFEAEIQLVDSWILFYNAWLLDPKGIESDALNEAFRAHLSREGYSSDLLRPINGRSGQAFQNLIIARKNPDIFTAVRKFTGNDIQLTPVEKRLAFREAVEIYQSMNTDRSRPLPSFDDIDIFHKNRIFLPNTGVLCPSRYAFRRGGNIFVSKMMIAYYAQFFSIPNEISVDELSTLQPDDFTKVRELRDALDQYRRKIEESLGIQLPNLNVNSPGSEHEFMQIAVKSSVMFASIDTQDPFTMEVLFEFVKRHGKIDVVVPAHEMPYFPEIIKRIPKRGRLPDPSVTLETFIKTWKHINPAGFDLAEKILADPPTAKRMKAIRSLQFNMVKEHGELKTELCVELNIPDFPLPTPGEIDRYVGKCGGTGYLALLRDVENLVWPEVEQTSAEILGNENGIIFNSFEQKKMLKHSYLNSDTMNINFSPRAIVRMVTEQELIKAQESLIAEDGSSLIDLDEVEAQKPNTRIAALSPQKIADFERIVLSEWIKYTEKLLSRGGQTPTDLEIESRFILYLQKMYFSEELWSEEPGNPNRLFQGTADGSPISFFVGLRAQIPAQIKEVPIEKPASLGAEEMSAAALSLIETETAEKSKGLSASAAKFAKKQEPSIADKFKMRLMNLYIEVWEITNPDGYDVANKFLDDPPLQNEYDVIRARQLKLLETSKKLGFVECSEVNVPTYQMPTWEDLCKYPGGILGLLSDIEDQIRPQEINFPDDKIAELGILLQQVMHVDHDPKIPVALW